MSNPYSLLQKLYYDPSQGLISQEKFFQKVKHILPQITRKQVNDFIKNQEVYQQHSRTKPLTQYPIYYNANQPFQRIQIDLMDISNELQSYGKYVFDYILIFIHDTSSLSL